MKRRALVIGSETFPLEGAHRDAERMADCLSREHGFEVDLRKGKDAGRAGILDGYAQLLARLGPEDAAVVYYSGHGSFEVVPQAVAPSGPFSRTRYQGIVPFDYEESTPDDFRGILAEELSIRLHELTLRTPNVAVLLDCCHAALISRDVQARPKAVPHPLRVGVEASIRSLLAREKPEIVEAALRPQGSDAVRLVACRQEQSAFEHGGPDGLACGVFTEGVLLALSESKGQEVSWRDIGQRAAQHVLANFGAQLPGVEGDADRRLFETTRLPRTTAVPVALTPRGWVVQRGKAFSVQVGDVYSVRPPIGQPDRELARARVTQVGATDSVVALVPDVAVPQGARGVQEEWAEPPRLVAIPGDSERREDLVAAVGKSRRVRVAAAADGAAPVIGAVSIRGGDLHLLDKAKLPLRAPAKVTAVSLAALPVDLERIAHACALRELHGDGIANVAPSDLEVEWGVVVGGVPTPLPAADATIGPGDGLYMRLANRGPRDLFVHVLDIGVSEQVESLTARLWPTGVLVAPGKEEVLFRDRLTNKIVPAPYSWPDGVPKEQGLRQEELLVLAAAEPADLSGLAQAGVSRAAGEGMARVRQILEQARTGVTRGFSPFGAPTDDGLLTRRIRFFASPWPVSRGDARFLVDDQLPVPAVVRSRGRAAAAPPPPRIAVVVNELVVHSNRALFSADIRVDALFVTPRTGAGGRAYHTGTLRFPGVKDGDRLPLDQVLFYLGPVKDFLQVCFWVSRDVKGSLELADMIQGAAADPEVQGALTALAGLAVAAPQAALAVGAVGAAATLATVGYKLIQKAVGTSIGVYRTSLLAADAYRMGRHPREGLIRAQDFSFSLEVRQVP